MEEAHFKKALLILNCLILAIGNCGGPMITRLYFIKGGKRVWFSSFLQSAGFPIIFIPLLISYFHRRKIQGAAATKLVLINYQIFAATAVIGILTGLDNYLYAFGVSRLPVSTAAIVIASQLAFTAFFAFFLVNQKFSPFSVNAVVLLTFGSGILALDSGGDRPKEQSKMSYVLGFAMTLAAAALYGLVLPMIELMYIKAKQAITYTLVLEIQLVMCFFATVFCIVGMLINHDFQAIAREAKEYELGETKYNLVIIWSAIIWQLFFLGVIGVISCASSLVSGILMAVLLPVTQVLAVVFFSEKFQALKGVALVLSLWGFASYFYGEISHNKKNKIDEDERIIETTPFYATEMVHVTPNIAIVDP